MSWAGDEPLTKLATAVRIFGAIASISSTMAVAVSDGTSIPIATPRASDAGVVTKRPAADSSAYAVQGAKEVQPLTPGFRATRTRPWVGNESSVAMSMLALRSRTRPSFRISAGYRAREVTAW